MAKTFILSDESLNSYGFWVLTSGIDLKQFKKNPVMLWNHFRAYRGTTDEVLPIGKWENIRIENGQLKADAVFDQNDEFAKKIEAKVEAGIINMASIGMCPPFTFSEDKAYLKQGQTRATVIKCKLREASVSDIGSNDNALTLYDENDNIVNLTSGAENPVKLLTNNTKKMENIALKLGLQATATEGDVLSSIQVLNDRVASALTLSAETLTKLGIDPKEISTASIEVAVTNLSARAETAEQALADQDEAKCVALVDGAIQSGKITADLRDTYLSMARLNFADAEKALEAMPVKENLASQTSSAEYEEGSAWNLRMEEIKKGGQ